jgi:hypothetical protein
MLNKELLSIQTKKIVENKKGYRYENLYGEGYRNIKDVCTHETFELGNVDIPETILLLYEDFLSDSEKKLFKRIIDEEDICDVEIDVFATSCKKVATKVTGEENVECIWLCGNKNDVKGYLMEGEELEDEDIDEYKLPDNICILSDIGSDGALIAYKF